MGLDQYLIIKPGKKQEGGSETLTGACGGLFPLAPRREDGEIEAGYWRKAYNFDDFMWDEVIKPEVEEIEDVNLERYELSKDQVKMILETAKAMVAEDDFTYDWDREDWEHTVEVFEPVLTLMDLDPDAKVYYMIWF